MAISPGSEPASHHFTVRVLGPWEVVSGAQALDVERWPRKAAALFRLLAVVRHHRLSRDEAIELLWPEAPPEAGVSSLKTVLFRLRRALQSAGYPPVVVLERGWVLLNPECSWDIDADRFLRLIAESERDRSLLEEAADLVRGEPLIEDRYEDWAAPVRDHLQKTWRETCLNVARGNEEHGDSEGVLLWTERLLAIDPLDETAMEHRLRALGDLGRRQQARLEYARFATRLQAELGVRPSAETHALVAPPDTLPVPLTSFIGRESELEVVKDLLRREDVRLLTLVGPGGVGKTRLALESARALSDTFVDGIYFVPLLPLRNPALVLSTIARGVGCREDAGQAPLDALRERIGDREILLVLDNVEHLLEAGPDLAEALSACPRLTILAASRERLHLSGEYGYDVPPLDLPPASSHDVEAFDAVQLFVQRAQLVDHAFTLTAENSSAVADICRGLDGLPLAIELAAARARVLPPQVLVQRLDHRLQILTGGPRDLPSRQQTLRDTIAWSYDLLDGGEQPLFRRLAVFAGGCLQREAETVALAGGETSMDVLDGLASLADKHLVTVDSSSEDGPRFAMLETIREYGLELLRSQGELESVQRSHARCYSDLAERVKPELDGDEAVRWQDRLQREHDNFRTALAWWLEHEPGEELRLALCLWPFWLARSYHDEARAWFERGLAYPTPDWPHDRAESLRTLGQLYTMVGETDSAVRVLEEGLALHRQIGSRNAAAWCLYALAVTAVHQGNLERAEHLYEESLAIHRGLEDAPGVSAALLGLARIANSREDYPRATDQARESAALRQGPRDRQARAATLNQLGYSLMAQGQLEESISLLEEGTEVARETGHAWLISSLLNTLGIALLLHGDRERSLSCQHEALQLAGENDYAGSTAYALEGLALGYAATDNLDLSVHLWASSEGLREAQPARLLPFERSLYDRCMQNLRRNLGDAAFAAAWGRGRAMSLEDTVALALQEATRFRTETVAGSH